MRSNNGLTPTEYLYAFNPCPGYKKTCHAVLWTTAKHAGCASSHVSSTMATIPVDTLHCWMGLPDPLAAACVAQLSTAAVLT